MRVEVLEVSGFEYLLADWGEDLREKIFDVLFGDDLLDGMCMQVLE